MVTKDEPVEPSDDPPVPLHEFLAAERRSVGLSQAEAAKRLGLGLSTVARWEQGGAVPTDRNLARAFEIYETDLASAPSLEPQKKVELRVELLEQRLEEMRHLMATLAATVDELRGPPRANGAS